MAGHEETRGRIVAAAQALAAASDRDTLIAAASRLQEALALLLAADSLDGLELRTDHGSYSGNNGHVQPLAGDTQPAGLSPEALVEALLFVAPEPLEVAALGRLLELEQTEVFLLLDRLDRHLRTRGIRLQRAPDGRLQLVSAPEAAAQIERLLGIQTSTRLSPAALETLAIIAYRQPVTRAQIEAVRGVDSSGVVRALLARGMVAEAGRAETVGRPILYVTTPEFLNQFGLQSLADLPPLELPEV